jgi:uncharacterized membrane protein YbhN (UPF0104 family)
LPSVLFPAWLSVLTSRFLSELPKPVAAVPRRVGWNMVMLRAGKIAAAAILLTALYWAADWREVVRATANLDFWILFAALGLFVPQTLVSALRWKAWVRPLCRLSVGQAARQTLAASALNLIVPSKLGDLSKAAMLPSFNPEPAATARDGLDVPVAVGSGLNKYARSRGAWLAAVEKAADLAMLALFCAVGWLGGSAAASAVLWAIFLPLTLAAFIGRWLNRRETSRWLTLAWWTSLLWLAHLAQIGLFLWSAGVKVGADDVLARVPLAIFAGLLPISFCGLGTRDAALVYLFADIAPPGTMAVVGLLTGLRYLVPGAVGIPFVGGAFRQGSPRGVQQRGGPAAAARPCATLLAADSTIRPISST